MHCSGKYHTMLHNNNNNNNKSKTKPHESDNKSTAEVSQNKVNSGNLARAGAITLVSNS